MLTRNRMVAFVVATGTVAALLVVALFFLDLGVFREQLEARASQAFGRRVEFAGPIRLRPSLPLRILVEDVRIGNPAWATRPDLGRVQRLELRVGMRSLLRGELEVLDVYFRGADVLLEQGPDDSNNYTFGRRDGPSSLPELARFKVLDSEFGYRDRDGVVEHCAVDLLQVDSAPAQPVGVEGELTCRGVPFRLSVTAGTPEEFASATSPWPLEIEVKTEEVSFEAVGMLPKPRLWKSAEFSFSMLGETTDSIRKLADIPGLTSEPFDVSGQWRNVDQGFELSDLDATLGSTDISGDIVFSRAGGRARLEGRLRSGTLALQDLAGVGDSGVSAGIEVDFLDRPLLLDRLETLDVSLDLEVGQVLGSEVALRDLSLSADLEGGVLALRRFGATVEGVPLEGSLEVSPLGEVADVSLSAKTPLLSLPESLWGLEAEYPLTGSARDVALAVRGRGRTLRDLIQTSKVDVSALDVTIGPLNPQEDPGWDLMLEQVSVTADGDRPTTALAGGTIRGVPIALSVRSEPLAVLARTAGSWTFDLQADTDGAVLDLNGIVDRGPDGSTSLTLQTVLEGVQLTTLEPLVGVPLPDAGPYRFSAEFSAHGQTLGVSGLEAKLGGSDLAGELRWASQDGRALLTGELTSKSLRVQDLAVPVERRGVDAGTLDVLDINLRVDWLRGVDAELEMSLQNIIGLAAPVSEFAATARLAESRLDLSVSHAKVAGTPVGVKTHVAAGKEGLEVALVVDAPRMDVAGVLGDLGAGTPLRGSLADFRLEMSSQGSTLRDLVGQASVDLRAGEGWFAGSSGRDAGVDVSGLTVAARPAGPIQIRAQGTHRSKPFSIDARVVTLAGLVEDSRPWPVEVTLEMPETSLVASGNVAEPYGGSGYDLAVEMTGSDLRELSPLFDFVIPLAGSFRIAAQVTDGSERVEMRNLDMTVGQSDLSGSLSVATGTFRPSISANLRSQVVHYDDLRLVAGTGDKPDTSRIIPDYRLPVDALHALDFDVNLKVGKLRTRGGDVGNIELVATLDNGRSDWSVELTNEVGGRLAADYRLDASAQPPFNELRFVTRDLNYGLLLMGAGLAETAEGLVDLDIDLSGQGASLHELLAGANGRLVLVGGPGSVASRGYGLWSSDLVVTMLTAVWRREATTQINCIVGQIKVEDGVATTDSLLLDTSRLTIAGSGALELETETLDLLLSPRPKQTRLVSVANPVRVTGPLASPSVAVTVLPTRRRATAGLLAGLINPALMLVTFADLGSGGGNKCLAAAEGLGGEREN